ncbi:signal recognition particle 9 kda protein [Anaeramoeba ignava]|uniref:Signal recognition particle 9 kDa protein n=1 Tax=Anaeramoeba ignava TaxID=1746090 RepID=A0A9Q0LWR8_ANAIG|nr:signal recognition particle 9 kda protein [Anaeramoeba ignava]
MVYFKDWEEFHEASMKLYQSNPQKTRFTMKYRHCDGVLVLKVTDDKTCLKYAVSYSQDLHEVEKITNSLLRLMASKDIQEPKKPQQSNNQQDNEKEKPKNNQNKQNKRKKHQD